MQRRPEDDLPEDVSGLGGWRRARPLAGSARARPASRRITINIDEDIIAVFKAEALRGGPPYQVAINQVLRSWLRSREQSSPDHAVAMVLKALERRERAGEASPRVRIRSKGQR